MRLIALLASLALAAATTVTVSAATDRGTDRLAAGPGHISVLARLDLCSSSETESEGERETDEDPREGDDERLPDAVLRVGTILSNADAPTRVACAPVSTTSPGRDHESDLGRPPRA